MSWWIPDAANKLSAVHDPFAVKEFDIEPPGALSASLLASFNLAHASNADPNVEAAVESDASAKR